MNDCKIYRNGKECNVRKRTIKNNYIKSLNYTQYFENIDIQFHHLLKLASTDMKHRSFMKI